MTGAGHDRGQFWPLSGHFLPVIMNSMARGASLRFLTGMTGVANGPPAVVGRVNPWRHGRESAGAVQSGI